MLFYIHDTKEGSNYLQGIEKAVGMSLNSSNALIYVCVAFDIMVP